MQKLFRLGLILIICLFGKTVFPATVLVTTTNDEYNPADPPGAPCSLREAIESTNNSQDFGGCQASGGYGPSDTINVPASAVPYTLTIPGPNELNNQTGDLNINSNVAIIGDFPNTTISAAFPAGQEDRVMTITGLGGSFSLANLVIQNGQAPDDGFGGDFVGGGLVAGAAINLSISSCIIQNNSAISTDGARNARGGGIYSVGANLDLGQQVVIQGNQASVSPYADDAEAQGGGLYFIDGSLIARNTLVQDNQVNNGAGGGIFITTGQDTIEVDLGFSAVVNNTITGSGPTMTQAYLGSGGGLFIASGEGIEATIENVTFSGNQAAGRGGGVFLLNFVSGTIEFASTTIFQNTAGTSGGGYEDGVVAGPGLNPIHNTIIGGNSAPSGPDCAGNFYSTGYNLIQNQSGCTILNDTTGNLPDGTDPLLDTLEDNGGVTPTHAFLQNSPALDAANPAGCFVETTRVPFDLEFDQRNNTFPRVVAGTPGGTPRCDIGAYEANTPDLEVVKTASATTVSSGDEVTFTITVTNNGPGTSTGVVLTDTLPAELSLLSSSASQGACIDGSGSVTCNLGVLLEGDSATVTVVASVVGSGEFVNTATGEQNENDPDPSNNTSSVTLTSTGGFFLQGGGRCWFNSLIEVPDAVRWGSLWTWWGATGILAAFRLLRRK